MNEFVNLYKLEDCHAALERIREERPITIKDDKGNTYKCVFDITSVHIILIKFILVYIRDEWNLDF